MKEPVYAPDQWVAYNYGEGGGFGKIIGGDFDGSEWSYLVSGPLVNGNPVRVEEYEIKLILDRQSWLAPVGQGSTAIYKDMKEEE